MAATRIKTREDERINKPQKWRVSTLKDRIGEDETERQTGLFLTIAIVVTSAIVLYVMGKMGVCFLPAPFNLCNLISTVVDGIISNVVGFL